MSGRVVSPADFMRAAYAGALGGERITPLRPGDVHAALVQAAFRPPPADASTPPAERQPIPQTTSEAR